MDRDYVTFLFRLGQRVHWMAYDGPAYVVQARVYAEGPWRRGYTALPQSEVAEEPIQYLLHNPDNILGDFWAAESALRRHIEPTLESTP